MPFLSTVDGTNLYYKDWGSGRPVVLIHGWPLSADSWDDQAMALADAGYRAIAYDRRGFGRSEHAWSGYDYDTLAADLRSVVETTGALNPVLAGFSMGGGEVARYLATQPGSQIAGAALISSVVPYMLKTADNPRGTEPSVFKAMTKGLKEDRASFFGSFFKDFFGVNAISHPTSHEQLEWARSVGMQASLKATLACVDSFSTTDFRRDLAAFTIPTLIIHGTADQTVPIDAAGRAAAKAIPGARLIEYDGAPHGLFATHKARLTSDLLEFVHDCHAGRISQAAAGR